jgi:hypothetical protein
VRAVHPDKDGKKIPQKISLQKFFEAYVFSFIPYVYQLQLQFVWTWLLARVT